jgi:hypothetical protein
MILALFVNNVRFYPLIREHLPAWQITVCVWRYLERAVYKSRTARLVQKRTALKTTLNTDGTTVSESRFHVLPHRDVSSQKQVTASVFFISDLSFVSSFQ